MNLVSCPLEKNPGPDEPVTDGDGAHATRTGCKPVPTEREFYSGYAWCLNAYPTVREAIGHLRAELVRPFDALKPWQRDEVLTNIYLLSCGIISTLEDYLQGVKYRLPWRLAALPLSGVFLKVVQKTADWRLRRRCRQARQWQEKWDQALANFLALLVAEQPAAQELDRARKCLAELLPPPLPSTLEELQLKVPSGFRRQDLTHQDVLALGQHFVVNHPEHELPLLVVGLRTSGSYLAPVLQAFLKNAGYRTVHMMTLRPQQGATAEEWSGLTRAASGGYRAVVIDDPPHLGTTVLVAVDLLRKAGFAADRIDVLLPVHPAAPGRSSERSAQALSDIAATTLPQSKWHKAQLLEPARVEVLLQEYFQGQGYRQARVVSSRFAERINANLQKAADCSRGTRLKCVYEVALEDEQGRTATRYVLAKSVGLGWLGYHAHVAGDRLARFVPPVLSLRDGILYSEWLVHEETSADGMREQWIDTAADYVAERARFLRLEQDPSPELLRDQRHPLMEMLAGMLRGAYGHNRVGALMHGRLVSRLAAVRNSFPTLIDGRMRPSEWVRTAGSFRKTDFEHHGLGKYETNVTDPAYDLADFILGMGLSAAEEARLLARYVERSRTGLLAHTDEPLFMNKLLAGINARQAALAGLESPLQTDRHAEFHRQFVEAWNFLTIQTVRRCGGHCQKPEKPSWRSPLVVLDIDGVLDRRLFGYPSTTAAGLEALSLFHTHGFGVVMNSARSPLEVREYCHGYGLAGGVGEYGSYLYDAVTGRERVLVSPESAGQLDRLREALSRIPGVFLNDTYQHSIRAHTYADGGPVPLSRLTMHRLLADLGLDRLHYHQTSIDSTVIAAEVDKGRGLQALLSWVGLEDADTTAVGDSSPDLAMFRVARRCFAPAQIGCAREARLLGCRIAAQPDQPGLLNIARQLVHPNGKRCPHCDEFTRSWPRGELFFDLLEAADKSQWSLLFRAVLDPKAWRVFVK